MSMQLSQRRVRAGRGRRLQGGFTLVGTAVSFLISGLLIAGAWASYNGMKAQMKVSEVDRMMDQYGQSALMDMTNRFCWAWGAKELAQEPNTLWKFYVDDKVDEHRNFHRYWTTYDNFISVSSRPDKGILFNGLRPPWNPQVTRQYHWWEGTVPSLYSTKMFDQRDRMSLTALHIDHNIFSGAFQSTDPTQNFQRQGVVEVWFTMQYRYAAPNVNRVALRTFADSYVRERVFRTQINMRNWDATSNDFKDREQRERLGDQG